MSKIQTVTTQLAIYDAAFTRLKSDIVQSFQTGEVPEAFQRHRNIALALGVDPLDIHRELIREMSHTVIGTNSDMLITNGVEAHTAITRIRTVAKSWGVEDYFIDMSFSLYGLRLLETTLT